MKYKTEKLSKRVWMIGLSFIICHLAFSLSACSESDDEEADEYANWKERNDAYFATLEDSLTQGGGKWKKIKNYSKNENTPGVSTDYIYVKVIEEDESPSRKPLFTDSVRVAYRGRLLPSATYPEGYVFDQTYVGDYDLRTSSVIDALVSSFKDGFATAVQHMQKDDRWRIYIPYTLGYGESGTTGIPGYSVLVFDVVLIDFVSEPDAFVPWSSRRIRQ